MNQKVTRTMGSPQVLKWSTKQANNAARVRENQRRHREKVRNYIAHLESRLAESQTRLREAELTIKLLTEELDTSTAAKQPMNQTAKRPHTRPKVSINSYDTTRRIRTLSPVLSTCATARHRTEHSEYADGTVPSVTRCIVDEQHDSPRPMAVLPDTATSTENQLSSDQELLNIGASSMLPSKSMTMDPLYYDTKAEVEAYPEMLPSRTNESTTRCRDAYMMIAEQNFAGLDASTVCNWLRPGFRRPAVAQDGCRVNNQLLFALLDHISSSGIPVTVRS
ncbi:hypothetical protein QQS21_011045 [Conoideocrella luteorostrata]|uniref:BZIP domain-containing protein n=1 Tax=Conoideocrella luteorostrata TaxID=1105319 RepID=A0AAJ0CE01_9HYPO|nr:hypothetical protein QQS21_011045 [Conoideocrella luteorostrata]